MQDNPEPQSSSVSEESYDRRGEQARRWGVLLLVIGVIWLVFALSARNWPGNFILSTAERSQVMLEQRYEASTVVIRGANDQVQLVGIAGNQIEVNALRRGFGFTEQSASRALDRLELQDSLENGTLTLEVRRSPWNGLSFGRSPYIEFLIGVPEGVQVQTELVSGDVQVEGVQGELTLTTVSGDLTVTNTSGPIQISNTSGDLIVQNHRGKLHLNGVSGDVEISGQLDDPFVRTVSGDVEVDGATGLVDVQTISGDIQINGQGPMRLQLENTSGDIDVRTALMPGSAHTISNASGSITVRLAESANLRLEATTTSGSVATNIDGLALERRSLRGTLGTGETRLTITTASGNISVETLE
ncbi:DUF4097 family beta strand repeat protein [Candidatus Chloroploca sp. M-50]|uniref:DUF4097 family beta strand repeat protein n=1 Tax=Candidatus Chloroploca mongolica TaxID=2528176 RepID=A0ABS4D830_9CHLR|nr:DUF4097 family beta strand repeat protein [Candidatus Chloroploca mongolica]